MCEALLLTTLQIGTVPPSPHHTVHRRERIVDRRFCITGYYCVTRMTRMTRSEDGERAVAISALRRRLGVLTVKCQCISLLGRLEVLGPGTAAAAGRRWQAADLERRWRREEQAHSLARAQGHRAYRTGFAKVN